MAHLNRRLFVGFGLGAACACAAAGAIAQPAPTAPTGKYVCPPCGCSYDGKVFDKPGICPDAGCNMTLIPAPSEPAPAPKP